MCPNDRSCSKRKDLPAQWQLQSVEVASWLGHPALWGVRISEGIFYCASRARGAVHGCTAFPLGLLPSLWLSLVVDSANRPGPWGAPRFDKSQVRLYGRLSSSCPNPESRSTCCY